ncbi:DgyrCDS1208 [Dimorphilus gyrociliatus]|uniref:DgyrCDS1208 n=1 Tax=Dimorphilus gyrociliatus TaxID=2664684 RepID=A0A7I8V6Q5_9ANNE|nr:DgyrCDS1208 [Dimorphilus gyrociliatus]
MIWVGVNYDTSKQLLKFQSGDDLEEVKREACKLFNLHDYENYTLVIASDNDAEKGIILDSENIKDVQNGNFITIFPNHIQYGEKILKLLNEAITDRHKHDIRQFIQLIKQEVYLQYFLRNEGFDKTQNWIINNSNHEYFNEVFNLLNAVVESDLIVWCKVREELFSMLLEKIKTINEGTLTYIVMLTRKLDHLIEKNIDGEIDKNVINLKNLSLLINYTTDSEIKLEAIKYLNKCLSHSNISSKFKKSDILSLRKFSLVEHCPSSFIEHLKTLQLLLLKFICSVKMDNFSERRILSSISDLQRKFFNRAEIESLKNDYSFEHCSSQYEEKLFTTLLVDCLLFYAENQLDDFHRSLCDFLDLSETVKEDGDVISFQPMLFTIEKPIEELFSLMIQIFAKTWKEMKASSMGDVGIVIDFITKLFQSRSKNHILKMEDFRSEILRYDFKKIENEWKFGYSSIVKKKMESSPVKFLHEKLISHFIDAIRENRLNQMQHKKTLASSCSFSWSKISHNRRWILTDQMNIEISKIASISRSEIQRDTKKSQHTNPALKIKQTDGTVIDFIFTDKEWCDIWEDGLKFCLMQTPNSDRYKEDLQDLIKMETQVRVSRIDNILNIPNGQPDLSQLKPVPLINPRDFQ